MGIWEREGWLGKGRKEALWEQQNFFFFLVDKQESVEKGRFVFLFFFFYQHLSWDIKEPINSVANWVAVLTLEGCWGQQRLTVPPLTAWQGSLSSPLFSFSLCLSHLFPSSPLSFLLCSFHFSFLHFQLISPSLCPFLAFCSLLKAAPERIYTVLRFLQTSVLFKDFN